MANGGITRLSAESIQDDVVKTWARDQEVQMDSVLKDISHLRDKDVDLKASTSRSIRLIWYTLVFFAAVLIAVVLWGGSVHIFRW